MDATVYDSLENAAKGMVQLGYDDLAKAVDYLADEIVVRGLEDTDWGIDELKLFRNMLYRALTDKINEQEVNLREVGAA